MARDATPGRADRMKAALKANMGRRKAQGRARSARDERPAETGADRDGAGRTDGQEGRDDG